MRDVYWAAEKDVDLLVSKISGFLNLFSLNAEAERSSIASIWSRNLRMYYNSVLSNDSSDSSLQFQGENGELINMHVPVARSDVRKLISIATRQRLNFKAQAESTDYETTANTQVADALALEYTTDDDIDLNGVRERALELAIVCGHSFVLNQWNSDKEKPIFRVLPPWMTTYNYNVDSFDNLDWFVVHYFVNRYSLAEEYPKVKDEILTASSDSSMINPWSINFGIFDYSDDDVLVSEFYHKSTPALPNGRLVKFINTLPLEDIDNPYLDKDGKAEIPVSIVIPEYIQPYLLGYPKICDLLPLQEMTDHQFSVMASIFASLGVPAILNPRGSGMNASNMSGLKVISYSPQMGDGMKGAKPEILELCKLPPNLLDTINIMQQFQQRISNVSGALQGILPPGVTAASAIATLSANAVEFIEPLSLAVNKAIESAMMRAIIQTKLFMSDERVITSVGPNNVKASMTFSSDDLIGLKRVNMLTQNPLTLFSGGRQKIAEDYMKMGLITTPEEYDAVMVYGTVEPIREKRMTKQSLVSWENQQIRAGKPVYALATDDHAYHIYEHSMLQNDPEIRKRPEILQIIDDHLQSHLELSRTVDVGLYAMVQTGKNLPPDQNTPTGLPEQPQGPEMESEMQGEPQAETLPDGVESRMPAPANPAQPTFDLGADINGIN
jgi:hypothetical protein